MSVDRFAETHVHAWTSLRAHVYTILKVATHSLTVYPRALNIGLLSQSHTVKQNAPALELYPA